MHLDMNNKNNYKNIIKIADLSATIISSRDIIDVIENAIKKVDAKSIDLDFSDVKFISRSAAHALLSMKENLERKLLRKKEISFINTEEDVMNMLRIVAANKAIPKQRPQFNPKRIDIDSLLKVPHNL